MDGTKTTWYCGKECQKKDWALHKQPCKEIRAKIDLRSLQRAAGILHILFDGYRRISFDLSIPKAERKGNELYIEEGDYNFTEGFLPGYAHVLDNPALKLGPEDYAMLLGIVCCDDVMIHFHECCSLFLRDTGLAKCMKDVSVYSLPGPCRWIMRRRYGLESADSFQHEALQITPEDGSQWTLDLTTTQYGYHEVLLPWEDYRKQRVKSVTYVRYYGFRVDGWYYDNGPLLEDTDKGIRVDSGVPADVSKAISWCAYNKKYPENDGTSHRLTFGMCLWLAVAVHINLMDFYIHFISGEPDRLRQDFYER